MAMLRSTSIQSEVPVYPRCPNERGEKCLPDCDGAEGVSQPKARELPEGTVWRRVNSSIVCGWNTSTPRPNMLAEKFIKSAVFENTPACPATPPIALAFSSCTSPWITRRRNVRSSAVGTKEARQFAGGLNVVRLMPNGPKTYRWQKRSSGCAAVRCTDGARIIKSL